MSYEIYEDVKQIEAWADQICILQEKIESFYIKMDGLLGKYKSELNEYCTKILDLKNIDFSAYTVEDLTFFVEDRCGLINIEYIPQNFNIPTIGIYVSITNFLTWLYAKECPITDYLIKSSILTGVRTDIYPPIRSLIEI